MVYGILKIRRVLASISMPYCH